MKIVVKITKIMSLNFILKQKKKKLLRLVIMKIIKIKVKIKTKIIRKVNKKNQIELNIKKMSI